MGSRLPCPIRRRPRRARFTWVRRRWRLPTRKASRSARKATGLTHQGGGGDPAALFFPILGPMKPKPALRAELLFYLTFLVAFALLVGVATSLLTLAMTPTSGVALVIVLIAVEVTIF